jgi:hypothetical protein
MLSLSNRFTPSADLNLIVHIIDPDNTFESIYDTFFDIVDSSDNNLMGEGFIVGELAAFRNGFEETMHENEDYIARTELNLLSACFMSSLLKNATEYLPQDSDASIFANDFYFAVNAYVCNQTAKAGGDIKAIKTTLSKIGKANEQNFFEHCVSVFETFENLPSKERILQLPKLLKKLACI